MKTRIPTATVQQWAERADQWLATNAPNLSRADITTGRDAWGIAHRTGVVTDAYRMPDIHDAHIQTALQRIFPAAAFRDAKRY